MAAMAELRHGRTTGQSRAWEVEWVAAAGAVVVAALNASDRSRCGRRKTQRWH